MKEQQLNALFTANQERIERWHSIWNHSSLPAVPQPITSPVIKSSSDCSSSRDNQKCMGEIKEWGELRPEKENDFMLIGFETSSIYIIKMQIDTLQHTQLHFQWDRGGEGVLHGIRAALHTYIHTYQEKKCHLLARPSSQWSPSSSSGWRTPAAQRQEPPHRWTCVTQDTSHGHTRTRRHHHDSSPEE